MDERWMALVRWGRGWRAGGVLGWGPVALLAGACSPGASADGGQGGAPPISDDRYVLEAAEEDCDGVAGLRLAAILDASGLAFEGEFSWTDLETGYEASRSTVDVEVTIARDGVATCIPFRHLPGKPPEYARVSYDAATLSMVTLDGELDEFGSATVWLSETGTEGALDLDVVRALSQDEVSGSFEASTLLAEEYATVVLVYSPSELTPAGYVSVARESKAEVEESGNVSAGVPHGFYPALAD